MDHKVRCTWVDPTWDLIVQYHDKEWGVFTDDDQKLFEFIVLESFQTGLSWAIILKKRENFRKAFDNFDPKCIAKYQENKVKLLLSNLGIVRSRAKIEATISNAKSYLHIQEEFGSFANYILRFTNGQIINGRDNPNVLHELSVKISKDLRHRGFKFMGPTTTEAFLQAVGFVDNHDSCCYKAINAQHTN